MKWKIFACSMLVVICLSVLVVQGVSQPPQNSHASPTPSAFPFATPAVAQTTITPRGTSNANFSKVDPLPSPSTQQELTFEQLVEAVKSVRARQKELKTQEADLLSRMGEKIEEKRKDLAKAEEALEQLNNDSSRPSVSTRTSTWSSPPPPLEKKQ